MKKYLFYKTEIEGLRDVEETVRVIEKSASSQIHFLKKKVSALSAYKNQIQAVLHRLSRFYWDSSHQLLKKRVEGKSALLVLAGEKGMVGGLYHELVNQVMIQKDAYEYIWIVGNKGREYLEEEGVQAEELFAHSSSDGTPQDEEIKEMAAGLFERFNNFKLKKIDVLYPSFVSLAEQKTALVQFLPFNFAEDKLFGFTWEQSAKLKEENSISEDISQDGLPIFEPSKKLISDELLKKYINVSFAEIILEAKLSEFAARTVTAESAVNETERLIYLFNRDFLKAKHLTATQKQVESFSVHQMT